MVQVYKLLFDLSLWYCLGGYFLRLTTGKAPYVPGFLALCLCAGLDAFLRSREVKARWARIIPLLLPLLTLIWWPGLWPALHLLVAWAYLAFCLWTGRIDLRYDGARQHFGFGLKLLILLVLGPLFPAELGPAAVQTIPYLVLMLTAGVCLLRMLREQRPAGLRQSIYMAVFVLLCALLTVGRAPQLLLRGFGLLYTHVLAPVIFCLAIALGVLFYGFYLLMKWLVDRAQGQNVPLQIQLTDAAEMLGIEDQYAAYTVDLRWLKVLLIALAVCALCFLLWRLFRRLAGERLGPMEADRRAEQAARLLHGQTAAPGRRLLKPREPRAAVRWYFARFLAECEKRGLDVSVGMTVEELCAASAPLFPGADTTALAEVYRPARYQPSRRVTQADVKKAADAWNAIKKSESKKSP
jgi:hypothetical protein